MSGGLDPDLSSGACRCPPLIHLAGSVKQAIAPPMAFEVSRTASASPFPAAPTALDTSVMPLAVPVRGDLISSSEPFASPASPSPALVYWATAPAAMSAPPSRAMSVALTILLLDLLSWFLFLS